MSKLLIAAANNAGSRRRPLHETSFVNRIRRLRFCACSRAISIGNADCIARCFLHLRRFRNTGQGRPRSWSRTYGTGQSRTASRLDTRPPSRLALKKFDRGRLSWRLLSLYMALRCQLLALCGSDARIDQWPRLNRVESFCLHVRECNFRTSRDRKKRPLRTRKRTSISDFRLSLKSTCRLDCRAYD